MSIFSWIRKPEVAKKNLNLDRIMVEDYIDSGYTCQEISKMMSCTQEEVYAIKQAKTRRELRAQGKAISDESEPEDPVKAAKKQLEAQQIQFQKMQMEFEMKKLRAEMEDYFDEDEEAPTDDNPENLLATLLQGIFMKQQNPQGSTPPNPPINVTPQPVANQSLTDAQIQELIDKFVKEYGKKKVIFFANQPDDTLMPILKTQMPGFTDDTYTRALGLLKKLE